MNPGAKSARILIMDPFKNSLFYLLASISICVSSFPFAEEVVYEGNVVCAVIPSAPLAERSLKVLPLGSPAAFRDWTDQHHQESYHVLRKIASIWQNKQEDHQYLVFGKENLFQPDQFDWEIVPYHQTCCSLSRFFQQFAVLWNICFGAPELSEKQKVEMAQEYISDFAIFSEEPLKISETVADDPFCDPAVIQMQRVLEGQTINVLYNYAPIGFGGERLHFLFVPKMHKQDFNDLSENEYTEACQLVNRLLQHFAMTRESLIDAYLFHKTGKEAGQAVFHWHLHLVVTSNAAQDFFGKLTVLKNMLSGSSPLSAEELAEKVESLRCELDY